MKKFKIKTRPSEEIMMAINGELDDKFISENMKKMLETLPNKWSIEKKKLNLKGAEIYDEETF